MLDVAIRKVDGSTAIDLARRAAPPLPVAAAFSRILPDGLRRGSTLSVSGSISLLLALLGAASAEGAWSALVGFPRISAEAADEYGVDLSRLVLVPAPGTGWTTAVGALLDAVDIVAVRPPMRRDGTLAVAPGDVRRLAARARSRDVVLMPFFSGAAPSSTQWPGADVRLRMHDGQWTGIGTGTGRLRARQVQVAVEGRGTAARPRSATLWLPAPGGGVDVAAPLAEVVPFTAVQAS
jgi:hypothetical protein